MKKHEKQDSQRDSIALNNETPSIQLPLYEKPRLIQLDASATAGANDANAGVSDNYGSPSTHS